MIALMQRVSSASVSVEARTVGAIGTGVLGGMLTGTGLAVFFVPIFFVVVRGFFKGSERQRKLYTHELEREIPEGATAGDQV